MKLKKIIPAILLFLAISFFHESFWHTAFRTLGWSWTFSKIFPYLLSFIASFLVGFVVVQSLGNTKRTLAKTIGIISVFACFGIAFALNPIFEGDFANEFEEIHVSGTAVDLPDGLSLIALPGCRHCANAIGMLNFMQIRNPALQVNVVFVSSNETIIEEYRNRLLETIQIQTSEDGKLLAALVKGKFPSYIFKSDADIVKHWHNNGFGTSARDWIESQE